MKTSFHRPFILILMQVFRRFANNNLGDDHLKNT